MIAPSSMMAVSCVKYSSISYLFFDFYIAKIREREEIESYLNVIFTLRWKAKGAGNGEIPIFADVIKKL